MGQYDRAHVFVCTSGETCPTQGDTEQYVKVLRAAVQKAGLQREVRINKAGCFSQCGHGPMIVFYPDDVWYAGVKASDLDEIVQSHIVGGTPVERLRYAPGVRGANKIDVEEKDAPKPAAASAGPAWHRVCRTEDVAVDGMKEFPVDGTSVLVIRTADACFAYQPMCPHEAIPLASGVCDGSALTCLEHMWQFDVRTGAPMGDAERGLTGFPIKEEQGELYVMLEGAKR
jgi:nitrite reductase/ring-hydroxylating ferredoxin subunit/(2Fe-2S) ferredoxin